MTRQAEPLIAVEVLGPVRCTVDGREVPLNRPQVRQLLAMLASRPGAALPVDAAIEGLWPDEQPADPRAAFRVVLSRLRAVLGDGAPRLTSGDGTLELLLDSSDLADFLDLADRGRDASTAEEAAGFLADALDLWRDRPFLGATGPPLLDEIVRSLDESLWFARTRLVEALQELDDHDQVVDRATPWVVSAPHRERLVLLLARSLAATGQKARALETLDATRRHLRDDFGVDPGDELSRVEHEILTGAVQLSSQPDPHPGSTASETVDPVGRDAELATLLDQRGTTLVTGEAGIGKSTLLDAFSRHLASTGRRVITIQVDEALRQPLEPISRIIRELCSDDLDAVPVGLRRRLFPERSDDEGPSVAVTRESLIRGCADAFGTLIGNDSTTLVIDDSHWLDSLSIEILTVVHDEQMVRLVLGARPDSVLDDLLPGAHDLRLRPLDQTDIRQLLERASTRLTDPATVTDVTGRSGGNPLFAQLLIDLLAEGTSSVDHLPSSVLIVVQKRLDDLRRRTVRALEIAAGIGTSFPLRHFTDLRPDDRDELVDAEQAQLLALDPTTARFLHALVAEGIEELTPAARRIDIHDEIGRYLHEQGEPATTWASHFAIAAEVDPSRAVAALVAAGDQLLGGFAWDAARLRYEEALEIHERFFVPDQHQRAEALVGLGTLLRITASPHSVEVLTEGAELARAVEDDELFARAVTELCSHGDTTAAGSIDERAEHFLDLALKLELPPAVRAELCAAASTLLAISERWSLSRTLYLEAFETAHRLEDPELDVAVLMPAHLGLAHPDDFHLRSPAASRLEALGPDDPDVCWEANFLHMGNAMVCGDGPALWAALDRLRELTPRVVTRSRAFGLAFMEASAAIVAEDYDRGEEQLERALVEGLARYSESWVMLVYSSILLGIRHGQNQLDQLADAVEGLLSDSPDFPTWQIMAAFTAVENGDLTTARRHWSALRSKGLDCLIPDLSWTAAMGFAGRLAVQLDDDDGARDVFDRLRPYEDRMLWSGTCTYGACNDVLALIADHLGDGEDAARRRAEAEELRAGLLVGRS